MSSTLGRGLAAAAVAALVLVSGCTVRPLLATDTVARPGDPASPSIRAELSSVAVAPVETRYAQQVRNHLIFLLTGGAAEAAKPRYVLKLKVTRSRTSAATIQRADEEQPTARITTLRADYALSDSSGKVVAKGKREISAPYDVPRQEYAVYRAEIDAENRAARELAEILRLAVAQAVAHPNGRE